jgi:hypothetical protein
MGGQPADGQEGWGDGFSRWSESMAGLFPPREERLIELIEEFRRRQRRCPDLVVRPWWTLAEAEGLHPRIGFVVEYCPGGRESVEVVVREDRVRVEGPLGARETGLDLTAGWRLDGADAGSPETLANYLLRLADRALEDAA